MELHLDQGWQTRGSPIRPMAFSSVIPKSKTRLAPGGGTAGPVAPGTTISFDTKKQGGADVKEKSFESVLSYIDFTREAGDQRGLIIDVPTPP